MYKIRLAILLTAVFSLAQQGQTQAQTTVQKGAPLLLFSPNGQIQIHITLSPDLQWSVTDGDAQVLAPSDLAINMQSGETWGQGEKKPVITVSEGHETFAAHFYKKDSITDIYRQLRLSWKNKGRGLHGIIFRAYDDGVAYRFFSEKADSFFVHYEQAIFNFDKDYGLFIPYVREPRRENDQFQTSFENLYTEQKISAMYPDSIAFLPMLVALDNSLKVVITEAGLEHFPGLYIRSNPSNDRSLMGIHPGYPLREGPGGYHRINSIVTEHAGYVARLGGTVQFPWRILVISKEDKELANNDMVQRLAEPCRLSDLSWIKPGKVSWDWWNDWNISHVDFRAGINTQTYKYYIDFAAANKLEYIIMDEGWSPDDDLLTIKPAIDLQAILDYAAQKHVGVILWATWSAMHRQMEPAFAKYSAMGVKGFKIDFLDRDDQEMTNSTYQIAAKAAEYKLMVDFHGMYKPDGLQRTYPNVVNFEGVRGMENVKWAPNDDVPRYDVTLPFIRMLAGPLDYTPGAMRNSIQSAFHPVNSMPMSQGTRCHQLAMYVVWEAPLQMLADNPTVYMKEQECTNFIDSIPTTFDQTISLDGKVGEYVAIARRKGKTWYVGAMTNWTPRDLVIDLSFLPPQGIFKIDLFQDGVNADRDATDYRRQVIMATHDDKLHVHLSNGGGWAARITPE